MSTSVTGVWVGMGEPSVVDWCEPNYVVTPWIAEFWNTLSSGWMALLGLAGLVWWLAGSGPAERRFAWLFAGLAFVGLGSAAFHGTLLRIPQALDELPMVYLGLVGAWCVRHRDSPRGEGVGLAWAMAAYAVLFTALYAWAESYFEIFLASYGGVVAYITLRSAWLTWFAPGAPALLATLLRVAAGGFLGTLAFCWIPEHVVLGCDHPAQAAHLHAWWHLGAGSGTFAWFLWAIADRHRAAGGQPVLDWWGWLPVVHARR